MARIFDFDRTVTKKHTFEDNHLLIGQAQDEQYQLGLLHAQTNIKEGIADHLIHDNDNISAIVTFHNNPDYIAGYIAHILQRQLTLQKTEPDKHSKAGNATNFYTVEGTNKPFLISFIPATGEDFKAALDKLINKNIQIQHLRQLMLRYNYIPSNTVNDFYDDSHENIEEAGMLARLNRHLVSEDELSFAIVESYDAVMDIRVSEYPGAFIQTAIDIAIGVTPDSLLDGSCRMC